MPANLADNISPDGAFAQYPHQIAMNDSGQAVITWYQSDGASQQIFKAERAANGTWTSPTSLADNISPDGQGAQYPQIAMNASGQAVITWYQSDGVNYQIYKAERSVAGSWSVPLIAEGIFSGRSPSPIYGAAAPVKINASGQIIIGYTPFNYGAAVSSYK